jgi:hypothetical protein
MDPPGFLFLRSEQCRLGVLLNYHVLKDFIAIHMPLLFDNAIREVSSVKGLVMPECPFCPFLGLVLRP